MKKTVSLISVNMWLLPPPFSVENNHRIDKLHEICKKYVPDFILLQEVWLNSHVNYILKKFKNYNFIGKKDFLYNKTGLMILSKSKPLYFEKHSFKFTWNSAFFDLVARKGWIIGHFNINGKEIDLMNIHLNCPVSKKQFKTWELQYEDFTNLIYMNKNNLIVAGDFNSTCDLVLKDSVPINYLNIGNKSYSQKNIYNSKGFHKFTKYFINKDLDIDHVMAFPSTNGFKITKELIMTPELSDHYPVLASIDIN